MASIISICIHHFSHRSVWAATDLFVSHYVEAFCFIFHVLLEHCYFLLLLFISYFLLSSSSSFSLINKNTICVSSNSHRHEHSKHRIFPLFSVRSSEPKDEQEEKSAKIATANEKKKETNKTKLLFPFPFRSIECVGFRQSSHALAHATKHPLFTGSYSFKNYFLLAEAVAAGMHFRVSSFYDNLAEFSTYHTLVHGTIATHLWKLLIHSFSFCAQFIDPYGHS